GPGQGPPVVAVADVDDPAVADGDRLGAYAPPAGGPDPRSLWPNILEAVKNRRRFTWILLSQNAQVAGFDGTTLQIGFVNSGARDNFNSSGSEDVLRQALAEQFGVQWKIDAVIDPSGGSAPPAHGGFGGPPAPPGPSGFGGGSGGGGGYGAPGPAGGYGAPSGHGGAPSASSPAPQAAAPAPVRAAASAPAAPQNHSAPGPAASPSAPAPQHRAPAPEHVAPEDDIPEDDDPDLNETALSGYDLIVRELGATVVDEFTND
ncbi:DNA polymerase III subunit gamma and tau, partial [Streptomyces sp. NPDC058418]